VKSSDASKVNDSLDAERKNKKPEEKKDKREEKREKRPEITINDGDKKPDMTDRKRSCLYYKFIHLMFYICIYNVLSDRFSFGIKFLFVFKLY